MADEDDAPSARAPRPFITSVRVEGSDGAGPHEWVSVWIRGQNVGTLCVGKGDGVLLQTLLLAGLTEAAVDAVMLQALSGTQGPEYVGTEGSKA